MLTALRPIPRERSSQPPARTPAATAAVVLDAPTVTPIALGMASVSSGPRPVIRLGGRVRRGWRRRGRSADGVSRAGAAREAELAAHLFRTGLHHLR